MTPKERLKKLEKYKPSDFVWIYCKNCKQVGYTRVSFLKSKKWFCTRCFNKVWKFLGKNPISFGSKRNQEIDVEQAVQLGDKEENVKNGP